jgi:hypothetical protein
MKSFKNVVRNHNYSELYSTVESYNYIKICMWLVTRIHFSVLLARNHIEHNIHEIS